ncbi:MAG: amidohydrolase family protein, partial [Thermodesulfobacteriota bacterium]
DEDILVLRDSGAAVVSCPESNMKLASGIAPLEKICSAGIPVALGTDSSASNNNLDMFGELATGAKVHKASTLDPTALPAGKIIEMVTSGGAGVLGMQEECGLLKSGMLADIIIIDLNKPHLTPRYESNSLLTYAATGSDVKTSIIGGRIVLENRLIQTIDLQETIDKVNEMAKKIRSAI